MNGARPQQARACRRHGGGARVGVGDRHRADAPDPYAACHEQFSRAPADYDSSYCFYRVTFEERRWEDGDRILADLIARDPQNAWLVLTRGHIHRGRDPDKAEALYRRAAAAFAAAGHVAGEVEARANLANFLRPKGRVDEARREVDRVVTLGAATPDPLVKAQAWIVEAGHVQETGGDLGVAYRLLKQAQDILPADPPYLRERALLIALGAAAFRMGRLDEALATYRRLESLALARGEALVLANARFNVLNTTEAMESVLPTPGARDRLAQLAERALATALVAPNLDVALRTHRLLADLLASEPSSRSRALDHARQCLALAEQTRQPAGEAACAWVMATLHAATDARESRAFALRALDATMRDRNPRTEAHSARPPDAPGLADETSRRGRPSVAGRARRHRNAARTPGRRQRAARTSSRRGRSTTTGCPAACSARTAATWRRRSRSPSACGPRSLLDVLSRAPPPAGPGPPGRRRASIVARGHRRGAAPTHGPLARWGRALRAAW